MPKIIENIKSLANHLIKKFNNSLFFNTFKHNIKAFLKNNNAKKRATSIYFYVIFFDYCKFNFIIKKYSTA